jgi:predicted permease
VLNRLRSLAKAALRRQRFEESMADELQAHIEAHAADLERAGLTRDAARRRARLELGAVEGLKEECRQARGLRLLDELRQDLGFALRQLVRNPGFAAAAIISLAVGIGANTAIFSVMEAVLFRTQPVRAPEQLFFFGHGVDENPVLSSNYPLLERYRRIEAFSGVTAYHVEEFKVTTGAGSDLVNGQFVTGNYHDVLGVPIIAGRGFAAEPDRPSAGSAIAVISEAYWSRQFDRDPAIVGRTLDVQGKQVTIVGVTAGDFHGFRPGTRFDVTLPLALKELEQPGYLAMQDTWTGLNIIGRLKPGVSIDQALANVEVVFQRYMSEPEQAWLRDGGGRTPEAFQRARLSPAGRGTHALRTQYDRSLRVLMAMVGIVLLIASANVANLLLVRASARAREMAVRLGLGASRGRIVRQLLTESLVLACAGGALGLIVAWWCTRVIVSVFRAGQNPLLIDAGLNVAVLAFTTAVAMFTAILVGLWPALRGTRVDVVPALKGLPASSAGRRPAGGRALAVCQTALCLMVLAGSALLVRTLVNLKTIDGSFRRTNVLLFYLDTRGTTTAVTALQEPMLERLRALPGVRHAAFSTASPLGTDSEGRRISIPWLPPKERGAANIRVTPDYFAAMGVTLRRGRIFTAQDSAGVPKVAIINETMGREFFGNLDPIGRTFHFGSNADDPVTIVGIAPDVPWRSLRTPVPPMTYLPVDQAEEPPGRLTGIVTSSQAPGSLEAAVRDVARKTHPDLVVSYVRTIEQQVDASIVRERALATLSTGFALLSLLLAAVGLYGVMAYGVARRTREIGIRIALGAERRTVTWQVVREALVMTTTGVMAGVGLALLTGRVLASLLFGVSARDPWSLAAAGLVLLGTSLVAAYLPARLAARIEPTRALRAE